MHVFEDCFGLTLVSNVALNQMHRSFSHFFLSLAMELTFLEGQAVVGTGTVT